MTLIINFLYVRNFCFLNRIVFNLLVGSSFHPGMNTVALGISFPGIIPSVKLKLVIIIFRWSCFRQVYASEFSNASGTAMFDPYLQQWSTFVTGLVGRYSTVSGAPSSRGWCVGTRQLVEHLRHGAGG